MTDPRQPLPGGTPRPAGTPQQQHPQHPAHPAHPALPQQPHAAQPGAPRPVMRPPTAPTQHPHPAQPAGGAKIAAMPTLKAGIPVGDEGSIALIDDGDEAETLHKKIKAFGAIEGPRATKWKRTPLANDKSPVRVRTFHAKLSDQGLEYLDDAINHFIDDHPEVEIKFVTTNVGMFDGKFKDFALIVNIWY
jgi:hypothetical protein